jgi:polysaccharide biosynthesis/export protein
MQKATMAKNSSNGSNLVCPLYSWMSFMCGFVVLLAATGCEAPSFNESAKTALKDHAQDHSEAIILQEGDVVTISFPGAPSLNTTQQIRRDGKIVLPLTGEAVAAGLTPAQLEDEVRKLYASQLTTREVVVSLQSSSFTIYVTGAVLRPGKVLSDHPMSALEAIMEAGGFDYNTANLKAVKVIRQENGLERDFKLNLQPAMKGKESQPFYLKPFDIIYVPEKFTWF